MINPYIKKAYKILDGEEPKRPLFTDLSKLEGEDILDLVSLANKVRNRLSPDIHACTILNAKSGLCAEDCTFCAQSSHHNTEIDVFNLLTVEQIVQKAKEAYNLGVSRFGIVTSGTGYTKVTDEFNRICAAIDEIKKKYPNKDVCASLGILSDETAEELARHSIAHYNINIQTDPEKYSGLVSTTHSVDDRIRTIGYLKKYGTAVCSGGIIGLGETMEERLDMAFALWNMDVDVIPLNVLIPIHGTPLEDVENVPVSEIAKTFALFRLINPKKIIKFAAGRETRMKDFQGLIMLAGANGFITGGYLTTRGRSVADDLSFQQELSGFIK